MIEFRGGNSTEIRCSTPYGIRGKSIGNGATQTAETVSAQRLTASEVKASFF